MAVTASIVRNHKTSTVETDVAYCTATLSGTYVQGGFTLPNLLGIPGSAGSSSMPSSTPFRVTFYSPTGYIYVTTLTQSGINFTATTKIFSAPGTELAAGTLPDATVPVDVVYGKR